MGWPLPASGGADARGWGLTSIYLQSLWGAVGVGNHHWDTAEIGHSRDEDVSDQEVRGIRLWQGSGCGRDQAEQGSDFRMDQDISLVAPSDSSVLELFFHHLSFFSSQGWK